RLRASSLAPIDQPCASRTGLLPDRDDDARAHDPHRGGCNLVALAALIAVLPMNLFVRTSLVSLGLSGWFVLPFVAPGHDIDIAAAYWFGVALWAVAAFVLGLAAGVLTRSALQRRRNREQLSA